MKKLLKVVLVLVVLVLVALFAVQYIAKNKLTSIIENRVAPVVQQELGAELTLNNASVDLFGGKVNLDEVALGNVEGFKEPYLFKLGSLDLDIKLSDLIKGGQIALPYFSVKDGALIVERSAAKKVNLAVLQENMTPVDQDGTDAPVDSPADDPSVPAHEEKEVASKEKGVLPSILLNNGAMNLIFQYVDYASMKDGQPFRAELDVDTNITNLQVGVDGDVWADLAITGGLKGRRDVCATSIAGKVAPIMDTEKLSFDLTGSMANISKEMLEDLLGDQEEYSFDGLSLEMVLKATDGMFDPASNFALVMTNVTLSDDIAKKIPGRINTFEKITAPLGLSGSVTEPQVENLLSAIITAAVTNLKDNPEFTKALKKEADKELRKILKDDEADKVGNVLNKLFK